jgi:hypothetical protein
MTSEAAAQRIDYLLHDDPRLIHAVHQEIPHEGFIDRDELRMRVHNQYYARLYGKAKFTRRLHDLGYIVYRRKIERKNACHQAVARDPDNMTFGPDENNICRWLPSPNAQSSKDNEPEPEIEEEPAPSTEHPEAVVNEFQQQLANEPDSQLSEEGARQLGLDPDNK